MFAALIFGDLVSARRVENARGVEPIREYVGKDSQHGLEPWEIAVGEEQIEAVDDDQAPVLAWTGRRTRLTRRRFYSVDSRTTC